MAQHPKIERLSPEDRGAAHDVLCASFRDYPVMRYVLVDRREEPEAYLREVIGCFRDARYLRDWPVWASGTIGGTSPATSRSGTA